jgi:hypothetical protein
LLVLAGAAHAQAVRLAPDENGVRGSVGASTGFERALLPLSLEGAAAFRVANRPLNVNGRFTVPTLRFDLGDWRGRLGAELDLNPSHGWLLRASLGLTLAHTRNDAFEALAFGGDVGVLAGWSAPRWLVGAEVVGSLVFVESLTTTAFAREGGKSPVTSVVLGAPGYGVQLGVRAGVLFGPVELSLRAGYDRRGAFTIGVPPVYATAGVAVRFN